MEMSQRIIFDIKFEQNCFFFIFFGENVKNYFFLIQNF